MVLESTIICVDNSDFMRNGDYLPSRLQAQQDAVSLVCHSKTRSNPENNVGLLTLANVEVLATLTTDVGRILSKLHQVTPNGNINLQTGIKIAHLALKHRQGKNHKMRIVCFIGSPLSTSDSTDKDLLKLAKRLKKEKVAVDVVSFGEDATNAEVLTAFIQALNGKEGGGSHLVTVPPGPHLSEALLSSPVIQGEDGGVALPGAGFEFGVDPNEDPELALALRVSMEEQRQRQEEEARRSGASEVETKKENGGKDLNEEEAMLERALAMSMETEGEASSADQPMTVDFANMTEEEQIAFAMQMSMQDAAPSSPLKNTPTPMEVDPSGAEMPEDYSEVMNDPAFLQSVLESLPGVDPQHEDIRQTIGSFKKDKKDTDKKDGDDKKK